MKTTRLSLGLAMLLSLPGIAQEPAGAAVRLKVNLYAYAQVSDGVLSDARTTAERIFRKAGIHIEWLDCPTSPEELESYPTCEGSSPTTPTVKLIDRNMARHLPQRPGELGFALLSEQTGYGTDAWILFHRVQEAAEATNSGLALVLANAIAHELGHLLLGIGQHTRNGIMRGSWDHDSVKRAERGELVFTGQQARQMRARLLEADATGAAGLSP